MKLRKLHIRRHHLPHIGAGMFGLLLLFGIGTTMFGHPVTAEALLPLRSVQLSDPTAGATGVRYNFGFTTNTTGPIGSISYRICSNYLYELGDPCTAPPGFDASAAVLSNQTGVNDFSIDPSSTANRLLLTRPSATSVSPQPLAYEFTGIINPDDIGSFYVRIDTYASTDGSGINTDYGIVVFTTNTDITITTEVPPYLQFCTGITIDGFNCGTAEGGVISFGELSIGTTRAATSQMLASTNAAYGYSVTLAGTTMTAGNNAIPAMTGAVSQVGVSQFGINARSNTSPSIGNDPLGPGLTMPSANYNSPNLFRFNSGDIIASSASTSDYRKITVSYIVNRDRGQPPGKYVATISYICLANF